MTRTIRTILLVCALAAGTARAESGLQGSDWPHSFDEGGDRFTIYQPRLEKWDGDRLLWRAAVSVENPASPQPTFGAVWIVARTQVNKEDRTVQVDRFAIPRASFPTSRSADAWLGTLRAHFPNEPRTMSLDRLEANVAAAKAEASAKNAPLGNDPPRMIFSAQPSLLVLIDGEPVLRKAGNSELLRVVNTRSLVLRDEAASKYYLAVGDRWLESPTLEGRWALAATVPDGAEDAKRDAVAAKADLHDGSARVKALLAQGQAPAVFTSTSPAELVATSGEPDLVAIDGTSLLWVKNADGNVFVDTRTNAWYVLASGRWFSAPSRQGPWAYVPGKSLPADFARIPDAHPAGEVLASVPSTPQAQEAVLANDVPQTAAVKRSEAHLETTYDGAPQLEPIAGTNMSYAANSRTPVIQDGDRYYACQDGVWFVAPTPDGPWSVADFVPPEIYSIPPSCPIHYVTYVRVYDSSPDYVWCGYTPGYFGACYWDGCIVWGTGWWHRPWIGRSWIGCPWSYGFGLSCCRWGWGFDGWRRPWWGPFGVNASLGFGFYRPYAAVYNRWSGRAVISAAVARPFGTRGTTASPFVRPGTSTGLRTARPQTFAAPNTRPAPSTFVRPNTARPVAPSTLARPVQQPQARSFNSQPHAAPQSFRPAPQSFHPSAFRPQQTFSRPSPTFHSSSHSSSGSSHRGR